MHGIKFESFAEYIFEDHSPPRTNTLQDGPRGPPLECSGFDWDEDKSVRCAGWTQSHHEETGGSWVPYT